MASCSFDLLVKLSLKTRWLLIVTVFLAIVALDFSTPSEYIWAYLYAIPILISVSFLKSGVSKLLLILAVSATLLNLVLPKVVFNEPSVLVNRSLAALSILISTFFMLRYIQYQEKIQIQERLLETERNLSKVREDLIATLTHDLKTPLLGEQSAIQHFVSGAYGTINDEQKMVLEALERSNNRELALVENLLTVYRQDNLGVNLQFKQINMDTLIADLLTEIQYLAIERQVALNYECKQTPPAIKGDELQLKRVLANLLHNALNYTQVDGQIQVKLAHDDHNITVSVEDDGQGLAESDLEQIFYRFYRANGERQVIGTGLGLYLSRQIIEAHQGRIWAENKQPRGCRFLFTLPILQESHHA